MIQSLAHSINSRRHFTNHARYAGNHSWVHLLYKIMRVVTIGRPSVFAEVVEGRLECAFCAMSLLKGYLYGVRDVAMVAI
mmetsp:Transcript_23223/g.48072  ORF Transcript_23223/g.48072 Transcript_23223/m.48072 type:complete len:80 (-) Transcript_23223:333-572(-)